ncbi:hypothetical protein R1sor_000438 [Riccia sorocarpa]|uniref:Uncharacterized protein n=1 Tax=Riccia sorocarpa TaxID=122646 RepID=A0ABD3GUT5_9MARC
MDVKVKAEPGRVGSTPEGGSSGVRDGEVLSGSQESSKKVEAPNVIVEEDWNEEDFILSIEYFAKDCNIPNEDMMPGDIPKTLVSDEDIEKCFGPRSGNKGRNGPKLNNCTGLLQSEVLHLFQVIDGHDKPVNGTFGAIFPRALYAERFLKKRINWAGYVQERHRNQLRSSKSRREAKPIGPHILRVHRVYKPSPNLSLEPGETDERAPSPIDLNLKGAATIDAEQEAPAATEEGISSEPSEVKPEVLLRGSSSGTSCLPVYVELKDDIAARENSIKAIHANISSESEALEVLRSSTKSAAESIALSVGTYKTDKEVLGKLETERTELVARKQSLETRLEDGGFDKENPEDMILLQSLEAEEEDLNLSLSGVLTKIEECSARLLQSQTEMKLSRSKHEELKMELERAELKVDNAQVGVEHTILTSAAATKVRGISPCNTILSEREEDLRDFDVSLVDTSPMPCTRSKSGKRNLPKGDSVRKVRTRSHVTEAEMGIGIGTPCAHTKVVLKPLGEIETPEAMKQAKDRGTELRVEKKCNCSLFFIETAEHRHELEVWERAGQELLKMTGQEFFKKYGRDRHSLHKFVSTHLASTPWAITVIGKQSTEEYLRVLSCSRAGITSQIRSCSLVNPPQPHVGVVQIASDSSDRRMSAVGISSSYNISGSLAALKRLQARVDMISKEVAEVIAAVELEQEPEEFDDSTSDWA